MQKMQDSLRHASKEGRLRFLQETFRLLFELHDNLEVKVAERQEDLDRAIWLYTSDPGDFPEYRERYMKMCAESLADAQMELSDLLSLLWVIKENPSDWLQKYREEM